MHKTSTVQGNSFELAEDEIQTSSTWASFVWTAGIKENVDVDGHALGFFWDIFRLLSVGLRFVYTDGVYLHSDVGWSIVRFIRRNLPEVFV